MMVCFCPKNVPEIHPEVVVPERSGPPSGTINYMILHENKRSGRKTFRTKIRNGNILILKEKNVPVFSSSLRLDRGRNKNRPHYLVNMIIKYLIKGEPMNHKIWNFGGQLYAKVGTRPKTLRDGSITELIIWRTHCADCGAMFEATSLDYQPKYISRRCSEHLAPGRKVNRHVLWGQPIPLSELMGITPVTQKPQSEKRTAAMFLQEPATVLTTPNLLEKRHG